MTPEFARTYRIDELGGAPRSVMIEAEEGERAALASRFGLIAVERLHATADLARDGEVVSATGRIDAAVIQACVASGEPVPEQIDEAFTLRFVPTAATTQDAEEVALAADELDEIDYEGGAVDLGEAVAQTLALALNPFPRAPGADERLRNAGVLGEGEAGPFAVLKALKDRL